MVPFAGLQNTHSSIQLPHNLHIFLLPLRHQYHPNLLRPLHLIPYIFLIRFLLLLLVRMQPCCLQPGLGSL